jgi:FkbM family methyltransferase
MRRIDRIKLEFTRNWKLPGKERLANWLKPSGVFRSKDHKGIVWLNNEDIAIYTNADNYIEWAILSTGTYEDEINKLIRISLKKGGNALDIGGNIGLQSIRMSQCAGDTGKVYSFEPLDYLREKFKANTLLNKTTNITLFPFALSDKEGEANFAIDPAAWNQGTFSLGRAGEGTDRQQVRIKVADDISEIRDLDSLDLIKIDVEGFEYQVLRGLKNTIQRHQPRIIFEYDEHYWVNTGQSIAGCYFFLTALNYSLYQISAVTCELITDPAQIIGGNIFGIPKPVHE